MAVRWPADPIEISLKLPLSLKEIEISSSGNQHQTLSSQEGSSCLK
ncbi:hypothetical protein OF001_U30132 [Pseudomonas sp. OF001]|nr:hypothetical protein OF001_U30132 [Pseudomonas sp. OF001]